MSAFEFPSSSNCKTPKDFIAQQVTDTSLKSSLNVAFLRSSSSGHSGFVGAGAAPHLPNLPPTLFFSSSTTDNTTASTSADPLSGSQHSATSVTTIHKFENSANRGSNTNANSKPANSMNDVSQDGFMKAGDNSTDCNDERVNEAEQIAKSITMQSIDRLEHHLPRIVVEQLIADIKRKKDQERLDKKSSLLARGPMTLEVPIPMLGTAAHPLRPPSTAVSATAEPATAPPMSSRSSIRSIGSMSGLLNTLNSLDELLEEEFSSSDECSSSSEEDSSYEDDDEGASDCGSDSDEQEESSDEDSDEAGSEVEHSVVTLFSDENVSDIDADDDMSDIDDGADHNHPRHLDEDDDEDCISTSDLRAAAVTPYHNYPGSCSSASGGGSGSFNASYRNNRATHPCISNGSACNWSSADSGHRSSRSGSKHIAAATKTEFEVGKLRQGRLDNRRLESDTSGDDRSMSVDLTTLSEKSDAVPSQFAEVQATRHVSAILFLDISGFTKLSRSLEVEALSKIINIYFDIIVSEIKAHGGDILKFAGDALIVEWTKEMLPSGQQHLPVTLLAALCASKLVDKCSDYPVVRSGNHICTLNLHCALGYGSVVGAHCGDMDRMEYIILGDSIQQITAGMNLSQLGEVVASPEAMRALLEGDHVDFEEGYRQGESHTLAFKHDKKFKVKSSLKLPNIVPRKTVSELCQNWSAYDLEDLQRRMSRYVHSVVYADEFSNDDGGSTPGHLRKSIVRTSNVKSGQTQSELRDVFTVFIQPKITGNLNGESAGDEETLQLLNSIMFIVNSEVTHYKAHLRQFIVDDKGLVIIVNLGLRGSTFPNMIEERAIPCISNIKTLLKTELDVECKMGATYGKVYCGVVGGVTRHEYAILGPSGNLAARLMASKSNPGILVDEGVKNKAGERPFKALPPVKAKGYDNLVKIYNPKENVRKAWKNVSEEFVGRHEEIDGLMRTAKSVVEEAFACKTVFISGPYGIGKSYLLSQVAQEIENYSKSQGIQTHVSRLVFCEDDSFRPFSIVRPLFLDLLRRKQHVPSFGAAETAGHTESLIQKAEVDQAQLYVSLLQICLEAKIPMQYIEMFGGLIFSTKLSDIGTWSDRSRKMSEWNAIARHLVTTFLHCTADYGLVLLALDDASGVDEMSWKILQRLYQRANNLLVITTARNEFDLNINAEFWEDLNEEGIDSGRFRHLRMAPMKLKDVGELACKRLGMVASDLDETLSKTVACQSRGNPLLACEILDVMYRDNGCPENAESGAALSKIEELLLNRLDELAPLDRSHLNLGSILGFTFAEKDVVLVMEKYNDVREEDKKRHAQNVHKSLQASVQFGILKCSDDGYNAKYTFAHALWMKTIALHILDAWKDEMRVLIEAATNEGDISIKYDWDELAKVKASLNSMQQQNMNILQSISELRALINRAR